jgi:hypothetical protein
MRYPPHWIAQVLEKIMDNKLVTNVAPSTSAVITEIEHDLKTGAIEHESVFT